MNPVAYIDIGAGALGLMRRPTLKSLARLRQDGATHLVTLLAEADARQLGNAAKAAGLHWVWIPLLNGDPPLADRDHELRRKLEDVVAAIHAGGRVLLHCSAGLHRTGMFAYAMLRLHGHDRDRARQVLATVRNLDEVGAHRLAWGDRIADACVDVY